MRSAARRDDNGAAPCRSMIPASTAHSATAVTHVHSSVMATGGAAQLSNTAEGNQIGNPTLLIESSIVTGGHCTNTRSYVGQSLIKSLSSAVESADDQSK